MNTETFITQNLKYLPKSKHSEVLEKLKSLDENKLSLIHGIEFKNPNIWLAMYLIIPFFACVDRFFLRDWKWAFIKILLLLITYAFGPNTEEILGKGNFVLGAIIYFGSFILILGYDLLTIRGRVKENNLHTLMKVIS